MVSLPNALSTALAFADLQNRLTFWLYFWCLLEYNIALMCACAPSLRSLGRSFLERYRRSSCALRNYYVHEWADAEDDLTSMDPYCPQDRIKRETIITIDDREDVGSFATEPKVIRTPEYYEELERRAKERDRIVTLQAYEEYARPKNEQDRGSKDTFSLYPSVARSSLVQEERPPSWPLSRLPKMCEWEYMDNDLVLRQDAA